MTIVEEDVGSDSYKARLNQWNKDYLVNSNSFKGWTSYFESENKTKLSNDCKENQKNRQN